MVKSPRLNSDFQGNCTSQDSQAQVQILLYKINTLGLRPLDKIIQEGLRRYSKWYKYWVGFVCPVSPRSQDKQNNHFLAKTAHCWYVFLQSEGQRVCCLRFHDKVSMQLKNLSNDPWLPSLSKWLVGNSLATHRKWPVSWIPCSLAFHVHESWSRQVQRFLAESFYRGYWRLKLWYGFKRTFTLIRTLHTRMSTTKIQNGILMFNTYDHTTKSGQVRQTLDSRRHFSKKCCLLVSARLRGFSTRNLEKQPSRWCQSRTRQLNDRNQHRALFPVWWK